VRTVTNLWLELYPKVVIKISHFLAVVVVADGDVAFLRTGGTSLLGSRHIRRVCGVELQASSFNY